MDRTEKMPGVTPYLTVKGAVDAIALYQRAFGATENARMPAEDGKRLMHADISINGGRVLLSDEFPEHDGVCAPSAEKVASVSIALHFDKPADVDATFKRAVEAGCTAIMGPEDTFWQARFAMLNDPFGHRWMLNAPLA